MEKDELLSYIKSFAHGGVVTKQELIEAFDAGTDANFVKKDMTWKSKKLDISSILYYIGGIIVILGIIILISKNWGIMVPAIRVVITLGPALLCFCAGSTLLYSNVDPKQNRQNRAVIAIVFHFIAVVLLPIGLVVTVDAFGYSVGTPWWQLLLSAILFLVYVVSLRFLKRPFFAVATALFGTSFLYALVAYALSQVIGIQHIYAYLTFIIGCGYISIGHGLTYSIYKKLQGFFYTAGVLGALGAAFSLTGWYPQNALWELVFPFLLAVPLFGSVYLKSKSVLTFGIIFLIAYLFKITGEYFANSVGWPLALVVAGFVLIGVGALAVYLGKRIQLTI